MIPDIAGDDYGISFLDTVKSYIDIFGDDPDSGRVDEDLVAFPAAFRMVCTICFNVSMGKPSSNINPADK